MKYTLTHSLFLGLSLLLATGCDKEDEQDPTPEPLPEPTVVYNRSIVYADNGQRRDTVFQAKQVVATSIQNKTDFYVRVAPATSSETVSFILDRTKIKASLVGSYTLKNMKNFDVQDADVTYSYRLAENLGGGTVLFFSKGQNLTGNLIITAYDAKRQLLSGSYDVIMPGNYDPTVAYSSFPKRRCDITLRGSFTNIPLKTEE
ncbi:hypothetical protein [Hymenobacter metallicola]|uniref:Uncharacterized protein n=1 Tax=Hymenobacter metallicola TaxID=2563114 RepID=A0A4Z0QF74_9BACT|nr:hypothetical protein [Hymenobacter metallicola]TGE27711.1 hypothetical protein E5K02_15205 [Hymenobacter metallicola]